MGEGGRTSPPRPPWKVWGTSMQLPENLRGRTQPLKNQERNRLKTFFLHPAPLLHSK